MKSINRYFLIRDIQILLLVTSIGISCGALFLSYKALKNSRTPILIGIDENGTRIIYQDSDPLFKTEVVNFIKTYIEKLYNFEPRTFSKNVGFATGFMSESLWNSKRDQIQSLQEKVKSNQISIKTELKKLTKEDDGSFQATLESTQILRASKSKRTFRLKLLIAETTRSKQNPFGMEVTHYEEIY